MSIRGFVAGAAFIIGSIAQAQSSTLVATPQVCFHDVREFEAVRANLPAPLQGGAVYAIHKSLTMRGGFRVFQAGSRFVIQAKGKSILGQRIDEDQNIKLTCVQGSKLQVWLDDGRYDEMTIEPPGFRFHGFMFKMVSEADYLKFSRR